MPDPNQTRTNHILHSIVRALDRNARMIDAAVDLRALRVEVKMNTKTGRPRCAIVTPEMETEAETGCEKM